jgi:Meiotically up-regulated gene 113
VYVISNIGTFGAGVVKIGLTRRLEPMDRIRELGDASVPFPFDVHAIYFSDDAVTLESELHAAFSERRLNHVNLRREFFFANPQQVRKVLADKVGNLLEFTEDPEATQYFQSQSYWPASA